ncbi:hypothetical protein PIB30_112228, partial [Stylosanthes scabra]|nr:hypothetical protein [Stylosanthes scabra]
TPFPNVTPRQGRKQHVKLDNLDSSYFPKLHRKQPTILLRSGPTYVPSSTTNHAEN